MLRLLVPVLLAALGVGAGIGAGILLAPEKTAGAAGEGADADAAACECPGAPPDPAEDMPPASADGSADADSEFIRMTNQFVVPVVEGGRVSALVVLSLSLETEPGLREAVHAREPKLRDGFLQAMFDHANAGGFSGNFTSGSKIAPLRSALREVARRTLGPGVRDVLVTDIARQDS